MASEYRRLSVNTSLRDAKIFADDSSSAEDTIQNIKQEFVEEDDSCEQFENYYTDNAVSVSIQSSGGSQAFTSILKEGYSSLCVDSPIKQERIDFETKLKFETDESTNEVTCPPPPVITVKREVTEPEIPCPPAPMISIKRNLLKRRMEPHQRNPSESESDCGVSPVKRGHFETLPKKSLGKVNIKRRQPESDPQVLSRRQKQIDYGKNTIGYERYLTLIPRNKRASSDPQTPDKYRKYSRRGWDGLIKQWRLKLHRFDPNDEEIDIKQEDIEEGETN